MGTGNGNYCSKTCITYINIWYVSCAELKTYLCQQCTLFGRSLQNYLTLLRAVISGLYNTIKHSCSVYEWYECESYDHELQ